LIEVEGDRYGDAGFFLRFASGDPNAIERMFSA
jgi:hypothetical protein